MRRTQICRISVSGRRSFLVGERLGYASATSSIATRARRCSSSRCAQGARATPATAPGPEAPRLERILSEMRTQARLDALT
jgi:hypothetical protein